MIAGAPLCCRIAKDGLNSPPDIFQDRVAGAQAQPETQEDSMDRIRIVGGNPLNGVIPISGAKNAALPLMIASL